MTKRQEYFTKPKKHLFNSSKMCKCCNQRPNDTLYHTLIECKAHDQECYDFFLNTEQSACIVKCLQMVNSTIFDQGSHFLPQSIAKLSIILIKSGVLEYPVTPANAASVSELYVNNKFVNVSKGRFCLYPLLLDIRLLSECFGVFLRFRK